MYLKNLISKIFSGVYISKQHVDSHKCTNVLKSCSVEKRKIEIVFVFLYIFFLVCFFIAQSTKPDHCYRRRRRAVLFPEVFSMSVSDYVWVRNVRLLSISDKWSYFCFILFWGRSVRKSLKPPTVCS